MKEIQAIEYVSTQVVCESLKIQPSTLRKYASLFDEKTKNDFYFARDQANNRIYTKEDVAVLQLFIDLKNKPSYTLDTAVSEIIGLSYTSDTGIAIDRATEETEFLATLRSLVAHQNKYLESYQDALQKKDEQIDRLELLVESLVKNNKTRKVTEEESIDFRFEEEFTDEKKEKSEKWWQFWV